jgi:hypothetical protein
MSQLACICNHFLGFFPSLHENLLQLTLIHIAASCSRDQWNSIPSDAFTTNERSQIIRSLPWIRLFLGCSSVLRERHSRSPRWTENIEPETRHMNQRNKRRAGPKFDPGFMASADFGWGFWEPSGACSSLIRPDSFILVASSCPTRARPEHDVRCHQTPPRFL